MPIVDIELVGRAGESLPPDLAQALADALGQALGSEPGLVWVRLRTLPQAHYAENRVTAPSPVFVNVLLGRHPEGDELRAQMRSVAKAVADACGTPMQNVHVLLEPPAKGRIAFGGELA